MPQRRIAGLRAVVTGASSGIGWELCLALGAASADVVAVARQEDRLRELVRSFEALPGRMHFVAGDITSAPMRHACLDLAVSSFGGLDMLVNNAGIGAFGRFEQGDEDRLRRIMEVNFFAAVELIRLALPTLRRGRDPIVVNVTSILGRRGIPLMAEYCASKFALEGFSQSLRAELAREGVGLLVVSPGPTATRFKDHVIDRTADAPWPEPAGASAAKVAAATLNAIRRKRREIIPSLRGRWFCRLQRWLPGLVDRWLARYG
jgi:short-subunit dehydrogenase